MGYMDKRPSRMQGSEQAKLGLFLVLPMPAARTSAMYLESRMYTHLPVVGTWEACSE